ncbi:hypothetical protein LX36DRAFT_737161 [Colletotrichum falcatum]|nr:hypothetical protein LX36DRAFT_737161 [Colletotrichum falcatum]
MDSASSPGTTIRFVLGQRPRFTRASNPKVRTGCITCRNRRKKCDEGKPACATCLKYQGYCSGYAASETHPDAMVRNRPIRPKLAAAAATDRAEGGLAPSPKYVSLVFPDQLDKDYFDCWRRFMDSTILFHCDLFSYTVARLSWDDPAVRHAALAIGAAALGGAREQSRALGNNNSSSSSSSKGDAHLAALSHYGKALRLLYSLPVSHERTLVVCLLFVAFECLLGRTAAALNHINHGVRIIEHCQRAGPPVAPVSANIISGFQALSSQSWALNGVRLRETSERVPWCCRGRRARYAAQEMPAAFETLELAHSWWNQVRHHVEHRAPLYNNFQVKGSSPLGCAATAAAATAAAAGGDQQLPPGYGSPESARRIRSFMHHLDAWSAAFAPLAVRAEAARAADPVGYLKALSLRIHYLYLWTGVRSAGWTDDAETARLTPTFRDIAALSRRFLEAQAAARRRRSAPGGGAGGEEVFTVQDGPVWALACTFRVCSSPVVRRDVLRLFREYPRRDGLLDTRAFLVMMEWMDKAAAAGVVADERNPAADRIVFDGDAVVLHKQFWDPEASRWRKKSIRFSIL